MMMMMMMGARRRLPRDKVSSRQGWLRHVELVVGGVVFAGVLGWVGREYYRAGSAIVGLPTTTIHVEAQVGHDAFGEEARTQLDALWGRLELFEDEGLRRRGGEALEDLRRRVVTRVLTYSTKDAAGDTRVQRRVKGERQLPSHALTCDLACRLSTCTRLPFAHAKPHEPSLISASRLNFSDPRPLEPRIDQKEDREVVDDTNTNTNINNNDNNDNHHHHRPPRTWGGASRQFEGTFWRRRVDEAGVREFQRHYAYEAVLGDAVAKRGVPCTPQPFTDYAIGLREHLPALDPKVLSHASLLGTRPRRGGRRRRSDLDAAALEAELRALQFDEADCEARIKGVHGIPRTTGLGAILRGFAQPLTYAYELGATFSVAKPLLHPEQPEDSSLWDLLEPFSACCAQKHDLRSPKKTQLWTQAHTPNLRTGKYVPARYRHRGHFWWVAQLMRFLFKPQPHLVERIREARATIPAGVPYIGMHVRHGDRCAGDRPDGPGTAEGYDFRIMDDTIRHPDLRTECPSLTEFMVLAERIRSLYGIRHIWLATDDADVVDRALTDPCYAHWDFHFLEYHRHASSTANNAKNGRGSTLSSSASSSASSGASRSSSSSSRVNDTANLIVDLAVLAKADAFVVAFSSSIGRLAYELASAEKHCLPPLISRDLGWCDSDGPVNEGGPYGHFPC